MSRTNVNIDDHACREVMQRYGLKHKRDAVNYALRRVAEQPMPYEEALAMEGTGWDGDMEELRSAEVPAL